MLNGCGVIFNGNIKLISSGVIFVGPAVGVVISVGSFGAFFRDLFNFSLPIFIGFLPFYDGCIAFTGFFERVLNGCFFDI